MSDLTSAYNLAKNTYLVASLLYYSGILTLGGRSPFGDLILRIPNLVIRKFHAESIQEMMLLPEARDSDTVRFAPHGPCTNRAICNRYAISSNGNTSGYSVIKTIAGVMNSPSTPPSRPYSSTTPYRS
uniref:Uncharacterized protein n=1 Tax=Candidatus Kentrum sp. TC TaxID=2126339 RepID=A0A450YQ17_9GAMM|nr:MAG: hypothetical protein BECKTC1821D_GA0114238_101711 [Candidatus Kentron sp. TC]